jgi:hypothetical protein
MHYGGASERAEDVSNGKMEALLASRQFQQGERVQEVLIEIEREIEIKASLLILSIPRLDYACHKLDLTTYSRKYD